MHLWRRNRALHLAARLRYVFLVLCRLYDDILLLGLALHKRVLNHLPQLAVSHRDGVLLVWVWHDWNVLEQLLLLVLVQLQNILHFKL